MDHRGVGRSYWHALKEILEPMVSSQLDAVQKAADTAVEALAAGHRLYIYDTGHMLNRELVNRAGGLIAMTPLNFDLNVENTIAHEPPRSRPLATEEEIRGFVAYALGQAGVKAGDVAIVGSVTGARVLPVEVCRQLRQRGVALIGITSLEYSRFAPAQHSSQQKLADLCDVVIDNPCIVGDAILSVPGIDVRVAPTSGVSAAVLMWMFCAEVVARQVAHGDTPWVLESMNLPGANERNQERAQGYLSSLTVSK